MVNAPTDEWKMNDGNFIN